MGDRECPNCEKETLIEKNLLQWQCLECGIVYDEEWLDASEEEVE